MKRLNNKGMTTVEVVLCFVLVVLITVSMYNTISSYNNKIRTEENKAAILNYKEVLTKDIQDDLIKIGLVAADYSREVEANKTVKYVVNCTLKDGTERKLEIYQSFTESSFHPVGDRNVEDFYMIKYGKPDDMIEYPLPDIGSFINKDTGKKVLDLSINNVLIDITDDNILSIYIGFYHPELTTKYAINIVSPINYSFSGNQNEINSGGGHIPGSIPPDGKQAYFLAGMEANVKMKQLAGDDTSANTYNTINESVRAIKQSPTEPSELNKQEQNIISTLASEVPIYMWYEDGTIYWWSEDNKPSLNPNASYMFRHFANLSDISGLANVDASKATSLKATFANMNSLTNVDALSIWDISNVESLQGTFTDCTSLSNIYGLENWNTQNVTSMRALFQNAYSITDISPLRRWDTSNVTSLNRLFFIGQSTIDGGNCGNIATLEPLSSWDVGKVEDMEYIFQYQQKLVNLNGLENWDTKSLTTMKGMLVYSTIKNADALINWKTSKVTDVTTVFAGCSNVETLDLSKWDLSNVTTTTSVFGSMTALKRLKTPKAYPTSTSVNLKLPVTLYDDSNNSYSKLNKNSPKETWLHAN